MKAKLPIILAILLAPILTGCNLFVPQNKFAGLQIFSAPKAQVYLNGEKKGDTPFSSQTLNAGEYEVKVATGSASWLGRVKLEPGTVVVVNRQLLARENEGPAGEVLSLENGEGVAVISEPDASLVEIDDRTAGRTPLVVKDVPPGDHKVTVLSENYLARSISFQVHPNYRTIINIQLSQKIENVATASAKLSKQVLIAATPTGWLRVRDIPSLSGVEIGKVYTDEQYPLVEEQADWLKIRLADGREGWISAEYASK